MKNRCNCISHIHYKYYWWLWIWIDLKRFEFNWFYNDMYYSYLDHAEKHWEKDTTIDRIDNSKRYSKDNCKRSTRKEQANNRSQQIVFITNQ